MTEPQFTVLVLPSGDRAEADDPGGAVLAVRTLLEEARDAGHEAPYASLYANGTLVRGRIRRTDLDGGVGRCWCARYALYTKGALPFCCARHEVLWREWDDSLRARTVVAQFIHLYGRNPWARRSE